MGRRWRSRSPSHACSAFSIHRRETALIGLLVYTQTHLTIVPRCLLLLCPLQRSRMLNHKQQHVQGGCRFHNQEQKIRRPLQSFESVSAAFAMGTLKCIYWLQFRSVKTLLTYPQILRQTLLGLSLHDAFLFPFMPFNIFLPYTSFISFVYFQFPNWYSRLEFID